MHIPRVLAPLHLALALGLAVPAATAQSFNIDVGDDPTASAFGSPVATFGGAAAQPGFWNELTDGAAGINIAPPIASPWYVSTLSNLAGTPTGVTTSVAMLAGSNGLGDFEFNNAGTTGNDQALMDDVGDVGGTTSGATYTISNLQNGAYQVYVYAWAPDSSTFITRVNAGAGQQTSGGAWPGGYVAGVTHTVHNVTVSAGTLTIAVTVQSGFGSVNGIQLVFAGGGTPTTPFCFGDGTGTACPCGNNGVAGNGCANSLNANGANLAASGNASIAADTFLLTGSGMPDSSCLYFQGTTQQGGGAGALFGDGLRCAGGTIIRLGTKTNVAGTSAYPAPGDQSISIRGANVAGDVRTYQAWYRNAAAFCTASTFNLTNGLQVTWAP